MTGFLATLLHVITGTRSLKDERGATAVEYGLMVALIAVVIIAAVVLLGNNLNSVFTNVASRI